MLIRIVCYRAAGWQPSDIQPGQLGLGDRPRRSFAHLPSLKSAAADQPQYRHLADLQAFCRLLQRQLAALCHLPFLVNGNAMPVAEAAHSGFGPGVPLAGALAGPVQDHRDAAVRLLAGQRPNQIPRLGLGAPAVLAASVLCNRQTGMVAALPVDDEMDRVAYQLDDNLRNDCSNDAFTRLRSCSGMMPERFDIGAQGQKPLAFFRRRQRCLLRF
jgi:hypothetical protein